MKSRVAIVCRLGFQGQLIPMVHWKLNVYKKELAKTDSPPSPEASKIFFTSTQSLSPHRIQIPFSASEQMMQHLCSLLRTWEMKLFHLPSPWVLGNAIKTAQTFLFLFALEDSLLEEPYGGLPCVEDGDRKFSLIMELSTQVSLQAEKITLLEEILEERERKIQQLEAEPDPHSFLEVKDSPECLQEAPIFINDTVTAVVYDKDM